MQHNFTSEDQQMHARLDHYLGNVVRFPNLSAKEVLELSRVLVWTVQLKAKIEAHLQEVISVTPATAAEQVVEASE